MIRSAGLISYCEIAAFGHKLIAEELEKIGCTRKNAKFVKRRMNFAIGDAELHNPHLLLLRLAGTS